MNNQSAFDAPPPAFFSDDDDDEEEEDKATQHVGNPFYSMAPSLSPSRPDSDTDTKKTPTLSLLRPGKDNSSYNPVTDSDEILPGGNIAAKVKSPELELNEVRENRDSVAVDVEPNRSPSPNPVLPPNLVQNPVFAPQAGLVQRKKLVSSSFNQCRDPHCTKCPPELHEWMRAKAMATAKKKEAPPSTGNKLSLIEDLELNVSDSDNEDATVVQRVYKGLQHMSKKRRSDLMDVWSSVKQLCQEAIYPSGSFYKHFSRIFIITMFLSFAVDPLFFFVVSVNPKNVCPYTDWEYVRILVALRTLFDFYYLLHILVQFRVAYIVPATPQRSFLRGIPFKYPEPPGEWVKDMRHIRINYLRTWFLLDLIALLPVPQVIALWIIPSMGEEPASIPSTLLRLLVLVQYFPRIRRCYPLLRGSETAGLLFESAWASFFLNLVMYVMSSHVIGSIWYIGGVQRWYACAIKACGTEIRSCYSGLPTCPLDTNSNTSTLLQNACDLDYKSEFNYGLFVQAIPLALYQKPFSKYIYSLQWGFTQISTLGGNQVPSYFIPEVFFMLTITSGGLLLFAVLIGNIQSFLQSLTRRTFEYQLQRRDVENWMSRRNLPNDLSKRVKNLGRLQWSANRGVDDNEILDMLSEDLQRDIRRFLCLELISKSELFQAMDQAVKDVICRRMIHRIYISGTVIIHKGELVDKIFFVRKGLLQGSSTARLNSAHAPKIREGGVFGEELLIAYLEEGENASNTGRIRRSTSGFPMGSGKVGVDILPRSEREIQCIENVEGFTLVASDVEFICKQFKASFAQNLKFQQALNKCSHLRRSRAALAIQILYRFHLRKRLGMNLDYVELVLSQGSYGKSVKFAVDNPGRQLVVRLNQPKLRARPPPAFISSQSST